MNTRGAGLCRAIKVRWFPMLGHPLLESAYFRVMRNKSFFIELQIICYSRGYFPGMVIGSSNSDNKSRKISGRGGWGLYRLPSS